MKCTHFAHPSFGLQPGYDVVPIQNLILGDRSGIFDGATIKHTYTRALNGFSAKLSKEALEKVIQLTSWPKNKWVPGMMMEISLQGKHEDL